MIIDYIENNPMKAGLISASRATGCQGFARLNRIAEAAGTAAIEERPMNQRDFLFHSGGVWAASCSPRARRITSRRCSPQRARMAACTTSPTKRVVQLFMAGGASHVDLFDTIGVGKTARKKRTSAKTRRGVPRRSGSVAQTFGLQAMGNAANNWVKLLHRTR